MSPKADESGNHVESKSRISRDSFDTIVLVIVGPEKESFSMHMGLLCNVAPYFKAAFQGNFVEATERVLELPDESVEMFKHFQFWVYSGSILEAHENTNFIAWGLLIELWVFGEARGIPDLQNAVIDALINKNYTSKQVPTSELNRLYENTSENAPIRRLFIDWVSFKATLSNASWFAEEKRDWFPKAFLFDLAVSLFEKGAGRKCRPKDFRTVRSDYYVRALDPTSDSKDSGKEEEASPSPTLSSEVSL